MYVHFVVLYFFLVSSYWNFCERFSKYVNLHIQIFYLIEILNFSACYIPQRLDESMIILELPNVALVSYALTDLFQAHLS